MYETVVSDSFKRMADDGITYNSVNNLYNEYCLNPTKANLTYLNSTDVKDLCKKLEIEKIEADQHGNALYKYLESINVLKNNTATPSVNLIMWGPMYAKIAAGIVMMLFVISILFEVVRKTNDTNASGFSLGSFVVGIVFLLIWIGFFITLTYSTAPWSNLHYATNST